MRDDFSVDISKVESVVYPPGMELNIKVGKKVVPHKVVADHKHLVVLSNGKYNITMDKKELYYKAELETEDYSEE